MSFGSGQTLNRGAARWIRVHPTTKSAAAAGSSSATGISGGPRAHTCTKPGRFAGGRGEGEGGERGVGGEKGGRGGKGM